jgi:hypothetical protein
MCVLKGVYGKLEVGRNNLGEETKFWNKKTSVHVGEGILMS